MFLSTGAFVRGTFADGLLTGNCYLRPNNEFAMLLRMTDGVLDAKTTVFDFHRDSLRVLNYKEGQFQGVAKDFERSADKCHKEILQTLYGQETGTVKHYIELTNRIKTLPGNFFGTFALSEKVWFYGGFSNGAPNGLGVLVEMNSKVQIGFFENGQLTGFGRIMWPNGVVMDGMIKKATINEEVVIYNQVAHEWTKALFKDNSLFEEIEKGMGYPREIRSSLYEDYFTRGYVKKVKIAISSDIFSSEIRQEQLFKLVYGEEWDDSLPNHLAFSFSGENNIEFDSRKDIAELKQSGVQPDRFSSPESESRGPGVPGFQQSQASSNDQKPRAPAQEVKRKQTTTSSEETWHKEVITKQGGPADYKKFEVVKEEKMHFAFDKDTRPGHNLSRDIEDDQGSSPETDRYRYAEQDLSQREEKGLNIDDSDPGMHRFPQQAQGRGHQEAANGRYPTPLFDRYDLLILQRAVTWESDKTLNSKNKYSRKTLSNKTISEDTKLNIVRNYVEDFMEAFLDKKEIDRLMVGIEAYQTLKHKQ
jgi:antitoxin component YwqK of YwqJK toxin-antitoxin module